MTHEVIVPVLIALLVLGAAWVGVRWVSEEPRDVIRSVPLFARLSDRQVRGLANSARPVEFGPGETIMEEGTEGTSLFIVQRGTVAVDVKGSTVGKLHPGGYFGELALIDQGPRTATVTAESPAATLSLPRSAFSRLLDHDEEARQATFMVLRQWLEEAGVTVPDPGDRAIDRAYLSELCAQLRSVRDVDWAEGGPTRRRWLKGRQPKTT
jgi:CRP-like cAMP-binding protein